MPIEAVKIPQNVYIEDRILGPITLKQVLLLAAGGGISYSIYATLVKMYGALDIVTTVIVWLPALVFAAFAFVKINDLSLMRIVLLTAERSVKSPVRVWSPRQGISINIKVQATINEEENRKHRKAVLKDEPEAEQKIHKLSTLIDSAFTDKAPTMNDIAIAPSSESSEPSEPSESSIPVTIHEPETSPKTLPVNKARIKVDSPNKSPMLDIVPPPAAK